MSTPRLRSALRLPWYVVLLVGTYCLLHLGLAVEHPCAAVLTRTPRGLRTARTGYAYQPPVTDLLRHTGLEP